jgi:hypothetical protein
MNRCAAKGLCLLLLLFAATAVLGPAQDWPWRGPGSGAKISQTHDIRIGGAQIQVDFAEGKLDLPVEAILTHIQTAAAAVTAYYGRFPVSRERVLVIPMPGRGGDLHGTTWGGMGGFPGFTRIGIGEHTTAADLADDWVMTHEFVHLAFPSLPDDESWMEEGQATYIEPLARVMTGELSARKVWGDMFRDMSKGEPQAGDQGLDRTHTWARTYWGGALFCLIADVEIRKETANRKGLRDALRAVVELGGTIDHEWPLERALEIGDRATGTHVLTQMYAAWKDAPVTVDLPKLWSELGVRATGDGIEFVPEAPLASIREAIADRASIAASAPAAR